MSVAPAIESLESEARTAVMKALTEPDAFSPVKRSNLGDCAFGALSAGAGEDEALQTALRIHSDPALSSQIPKVGGLLLGATTYLEGVRSDG